MSIPPKQIGWSNESNLLWDILKKISQLMKVTSNISTGVQTITGNVVDNTDPINPVITADSTIQVLNVTVLASSFSLISGLYEATISNVNILSTSIVEVIPDNASYTVVKNAEFLPQTDSSVGTVKIYSINLPASDITVTLNITNL